MMGWHASIAKHSNTLGTAHVTLHFLLYTHVSIFLKFYSNLHPLVFPFGNDSCNFIHNYLIFQSTQSQEQIFEKIKYLFLTINHNF